jgi:hypothetical protein
LIRNVATSVCPFWHACIRGVVPCQFGLFIFW